MVPIVHQEVSDEACAVDIQLVHCAFQRRFQDLLPALTRMRVGVLHVEQQETRQDEVGAARRVVKLAVLLVVRVAPVTQQRHMQRGMDAVLQQGIRDPRSLRLVCACGEHGRAMRPTPRGQEQRSSNVNVAVRSTVVRVFFDVKMVMLVHPDLPFH